MIYIDWPNGLVLFLSFQNSQCAAAICTGLLGDDCMNMGSGQHSISSIFLGLDTTQNGFPSKFPCRRICI